MRITFTWREQFGQLVPACDAEAPDALDFSPLACLLTDDGGMGHLASVPWLQEGLDRIDAIQGGRVLNDYWDRESWGAHLEAARAVVYSLLDDQCSQELPLKDFERVLRAWAGFITAPPDPHATLTLDL